MNRIKYFDFLRGIAIVMVIAIHAYSGVKIDSLIVPGFDFNYLLRQAITFAVPLFLFISGYFMANRDVSTKEKYISFQKRQIPRVYLPLLVWGFPYLIHAINKGEICSGIIKYVIGGFSVYYFIVLIIQFYLLLPLFQKWIDKGKGGLFLLASLLSVAVFYLLSCYYELDIPLIQYAGFFGIWTVFFALGVYYGRVGVIRLSGRIFLLITLISLLLSSSEGLWLAEIDKTDQGLSVKFFWLFYSLFAIGLLYRLKEYFKENRVTKLLCQIGDYSFGIYLMHMYILLFGVKKLQLNWIVSTLITLFVCVAAASLARKVSPTLSRKYLGF